MRCGAGRVCRALKMQARDQARVLQDKAALEVKVKDMAGTLEMVQTQRNELKQSYKVRHPPPRLPGPGRWARGLATQPALPLAPPDFSTASRCGLFHFAPKALNSNGITELLPETRATSMFCRNGWCRTKRRRASQQMRGWQPWKATWRRPSRWRPGSRQRRWMPWQQSGTPCAPRWARDLPAPCPGPSVRRSAA